MFGRALSAKFRPANWLGADSKPMSGQPAQWPPLAEPDEGRGKGSDRLKIGGASTIDPRGEAKHSAGPRVQDAPSANRLRPGDQPATPAQVRPVKDHVVALLGLLEDVHGPGAILEAPDMMAAYVDVCLAGGIVPRSWNMIAPELRKWTGRGRKGAQKTYLSLQRSDGRVERVRAWIIPPRGTAARAAASFAAPPEDASVVPRSRRHRSTPKPQLSNSAAMAA